MKAPSVKTQHVRTVNFAIIRAGRDCP